MIMSWPSSAGPMLTRECSLSFASHSFFWTQPPASRFTSAGQSSNTPMLAGALLLLDASDALDAAADRLSTTALHRHRTTGLPIWDRSQVVRQPSHVTIQCSFTTRS